MRKRAAAVAFVFLFVASGTSWAHHVAGISGRGFAGPITTISATPVSQGKLPVSIQADFNDFDSFSDHEMSGYAEDGEHVHSIDSLFHLSLGIYYGITDDFSFGVKVPYIKLSNIREAHDEEPEEVHDRGDSQGIGDIILSGQYRFLNLKESNLESSLVFGLKLPTGKTGETDSHGEKFEAEFQPGSGSWDPMIGLAATKRFGLLSLDASILYNFGTEGSQDTNLGDTFLYNLALSYRVLQKGKGSLDLILEANGEWIEKQEISGVKDENSGGNTVFVSPGMRFTYDNKWSGYVSVGLPAIQDLNGIQNDLTIRTIVGVSVVF